MCITLAGLGDRIYMDKKILTISMLVSGREETTEKSLKSLQPLRQQLGAELILTDTGCNPEYLEKLRGYADEIISFPWSNDFAKARNVGLKAANGKWFMFIDDDEWFEDVTAIIEFFQSGEYQDYHQAVYIARNYSNFEGTAYQDEWVSRLIRVEEDTCFEGRVHEYLGPVRGKCKRLDAFVHHYGYVFATEEERQAHFQRNISILKTLAEEEPDNLKWQLQLLKEYQSIKDLDSLERVAENALKLIANVDKSFINMCRGSFYLARLIVDDRRTKKKLWEDYQTFLADERNPWNVRCAMAAFMLLHLEDNELEKLEFCGDEYVHSLAKYQDEERTEQEETIAESIVFVQDYMLRIPQLIEDIRAGICGNGEFLSQPVRVWQLAQLGIVPLEELFLVLPISQWMAQMMVLESQRYGQNWEETSRNLASICTRNDIRYCYFDKMTETTKMKTIYIHKENVEKMDYETMTQIITEFAQSNLNYMDYLYTEHAFEGDMELLSPEEKAAVWLANGLSIGLSQWREKIQCFGNAAKVWPELGEFIKKYVAFVGDAVANQLG